MSIWDYATNPSKLVDKVISSAMSSLTGISGGAKQMASAAVTYVGKKAIDYVKSMFKKAGDFSGGKFGPPFRLTSRAGLRIHPITGLPRFHFGDDYGAPMGTPIPSQSSGVVSAAGFHVNRGNYVKVKSGVYELIYQHMQRMFAGVGDSVTKGQKLGTVGSTGASTGPHLHFEVWKNGQFVQPKSMGYATGAHFTGPTVGLMGEEDEEILIPLNPKRRTDAMKLLAIAGKMLGADNGNAKRPGSLPNVAIGNEDSTLQALLAATLKQNALLLEQNRMFNALLSKDTNVYLDSDMLAEGANRGNAMRSMLQPF